MDNPGSEFKRRLKEACDEQGIDWTDEREQMADEWAGQFDDWYDERPQIAQGGSGWLSD